MRYWIVSWDCNGVEFLKEITEHHPDNWAKNHLFDSIKEGSKVEKPLGFNLTALTMRARFNSQRHYEIYVFNSDDNIDEADLVEWFNNDPQAFADWVRVNHSYMIWDDRIKTKPAIV
jgi:hypothetical protein